MEELELAELLEATTQKRSLNFYAEVPCPMKQRLRSAYDAFEREYYEQTHRRLYSFVPTNCPNSVLIDETVRDIKQATSIDNIPDVTVTFGLGDFIEPNVMENFVKTGCFRQANDVSSLPFVRPEEFRDRYHCFNTVGMFPQVMLVDLVALGDRPVPRSLEDLLDPVYREAIAIRDGHDGVSSMLPLHIWHLFGEDGLRRFEPNVACAHNGMLSARRVGKKGAKGPAIYLMPWVFAQGAVKKGHAEVIWPAEGAPVEPIVMMVKKACPPEGDAIVDFMLSREASLAFADNYFISTNPEVDDKMPEGATVEWPGWDFVFDNDVNEICDGLIERFSRFHSTSQQT